MTHARFRLLAGGMSIRLGAELARGGEGAVFTVDGRSDLVAKVYTSAVETRKVRKLQRMVAHRSEMLLKIAAWPVDLVVDDSGTVRGFLMPRVTARRDIHELYRPKSRADAFPEADFRFLAHVAANVVRAFAVVHEEGHVIGDVNHGNLLVGRDATVTLIDCDSFQVRAGSELFTCDVGVPLFTPPELQGKSLRGCMRSQNHDRFGLAILLFQLLYMGRHPFAGRYSGAGEMPIEKAIAEYRFAYGPDRSAYGMSRPPGTVPLGTMGSAIAGNFIAAFAPPGPGGDRPDPTRWLTSLTTLESRLQVCRAASWHHYPAGARSCPWCEMESQTGIRLFGLRIRSDGTTETANVEVIWRAIEAVQGPGPDPVLPQAQTWSPPAGVAMPNIGARRTRKALSIAMILPGLVALFIAPPVGLLVSIVLWIAAYAAWPRTSAAVRASVHQQYAGARAAWQSAADHWRREASEERFVRERDRLSKAHQDLAGLAEERRQRRLRLQQEREQRQLARYLDRFRIDRGGIRGIGPGRSAMLASYGIETAADINYHQVINIPGFGHSLTTQLLEWQRTHARRFRFNPQEPVDWQDIAALDRELEARRQSLLETLGQGPDTLRRTSQEITTARARLVPVLNDAWTALKLAEAWKSNV
jgi:DNA-binding helix-hairpin-helix protein with protein kinase domain